MIVNSSNPILSQFLNSESYSSYENVCKNIDDFAEKQDDGFFLFSSFKVDEIKSLKEIN